MTNPSVYPRGYRPRHAADGPDSTPVVARRQADWRPEIQGLRAVAVLLVVVFHIFTDRVSGGVDIFLFISAFFLTGSFTRKMEAGRPLAVGRYWLHVFTRLMPMAVLTILLTLVAVATVYPLADRASWRTEALASALYVENWTLAFNAVDYYAADNTSLSPFQHFWSLSVQGQVFILWPLLFLVSALVARRTGARPRAVLTTAFASVFVVSLLWSVTQTSQNQAFTYFDTRARLWEFALGSLLALVLPFIHLGRRTRVFLGWAGLASMIAVGVVVDVQGAFPGWIALWPLMSATAVIVAAPAAPISVWTGYWLPARSPAWVTPPTLSTSFTGRCSSPIPSSRGHRNPARPQASFSSSSPSARPSSSRCAWSVRYERGAGPRRPPGGPPSYWGPAPLSLWRR